MTIFNTSKDPIALKKIPLRIWKLRDEVEWIIKSRMEKATDKEKGVTVEDLSKEYSFPDPAKKPEEKEFNLPNLPIPSKITSHGKAIISEINMEEIRFFCAQDYLIGTSLVIEFQIPKHFRLNGVVLDIKNYDIKSKLISEKKIPYRIAVKWTFLKTGERTLLRDFLQTVSLSHGAEKGKIVTEEIFTSEEKKSA